MFSNVLVEGMSCFQAVIKRELESFLLYKCNDGKELYKKKVMHLPKLLFCESQPITFLTSLLPPSLLLMLSSRLHNAAVELGT